MGVSSIFSNQKDDPMFGHRVAAGEFVETSPGVFHTKEAAEFSLGALADFHAKGRAKPQVGNVSGVFFFSGGEDGECLDRFLDSLSNPSRDD